MDNSDLKSIYREKHTVANSESFKLYNFFSMQFTVIYCNSIDCAQPVSIIKCPVRM